MTKKHLRPYTFRGRMMIALYICAMFAAIISLLFAYVISHLNVQSELQLQQQALAVYMMKVDESTDLPLDQMLSIVEVEDTHLEVISPEDDKLPEDLFPILTARRIYTVLTDLSDTPTTFVRLSDGVVQIETLYGKSLFVVAFLRVIFTALSYLAVFALMITMASFYLSKPVHVLTTATSKVSEGDFTVRLPDNQPGEMGELMRSFNAMTESLGNTAYLQKDFISSISHEFKTPIASIRGFAKLLQMPDLTEEQKAEYISLIAQESDRLSRLSETLLRLTALEQQTAPASLSTFSLDEQLRQVILRLEPTWSAKDIGWQLELDEPVTVTSDAELLNHVWINIIQNAIKFSPAGSSIDVKVELVQRGRENHACVTITDHGCGMDDETRKRIFDRFYQADRSRKQEGVGLGLCLVKRILDMMDGHIEVASSPGIGSTFTVTLPMKPNPHERPELPEEA